MGVVGQASQALGTSGRRSTRLVLVSAFLTLITCPALIQIVTEVAQHHAGTRRDPWPTVVQLLHLPARAIRAAEPRDTWVGRVRALARALVASERTFEVELEDASPVVRRLRPVVQRVLTNRLGAGSAQVAVGRKGFLFFRPAVDHLAGPPFLAPRTLEMRRSTSGRTVEPDPRPAILDFHAQLARRGIRLVLLPIPVKAAIHPEKLTARYEGQGHALANPSCPSLLAELAAAGVLVFDPTPTLLAVKAAGPAYLAADTHWKPQAMAAVARDLAAFLKARVELGEAGGPGLQTERVAVTGRGDLAAMLELPATPSGFGPETVEIDQVIGDGDLLWRLDPTADVLLLGDSFTNIYSLSALGWGEAAGFAEHLSLALDRPIDAITRNDSGSWATRSLLAQELARGRDRLAGKRVVIWELAARELSAGDWKRIPMTLGVPEAQGFYVPAEGTSVEATGTITAMGVVPRPRSAPYADFIVALHLQDLAGQATGVSQSQALVFVLAMKDYELTSAARYRIGQRLTLRLQRWSDVAAEYDLINRGELFEGGLMMQEPCWGEEVRP